MGIQNKELNKSIPVPLFYQLKTLILDEIKQDNYKPGDIIPTEEEISKIFAISRTTIRQAITELVQEGWLYRVKGKGTFVSQPKIEHSFIKKVESFNDEISRIGMVPSTQVLEFGIMVAGAKVAKGLHINEKDKVIFLFRKRMADSEPIVTIRTYLPYSMCSFVLEHDLEKERLYTILGNSTETTIYRVERRIEAVASEKEDAELLNIKQGKPIQFFESTGYNVFGNVIEYSLARYRGDRNSFEVTVFPE